ncbi:MAG: hypothetical protein ACYTBV_11560 [Planctomycetota bacterium]|jgi:hypothetical protein
MNNPEITKKQMNKYYILLQTIQILLLVLLFVIPLVYCTCKGDFKKGFWFTWIVWIAVIFIYGIFLPTIGYLQEKATGEAPDIACGGFVLGVVWGWLPGLVLASIGWTIHKIFFRKKI